MKFTDEYGNVRLLLGKLIVIDNQVHVADFGTHRESVGPVTEELLNNVLGGYSDSNS